MHLMQGQPLQHHSLRCHTWILGPSLASLLDVWWAQCSCWRWLSGSLCFTGGIAGAILQAMSCCMPCLLRQAKRCGCQPSLCCGSALVPWGWGMSRTCCNWTACFRSCLLAVQSASIADPCASMNKDQKGLAGGETQTSISCLVG